MFAVLQLNKEVSISVWGLDHEVPLCYAEGMVGAIPVFSTKEKAEAHAEDKYQIIELRVPGESHE